MKLPGRSLRGFSWLPTAFERSVNRPFPRGHDSNLDERAESGERPSAVLLHGSRSTILGSFVDSRISAI